LRQLGVSIFRNVSGCPDQVAPLIAGNAQGKLGADPSAGASAPMSQWYEEVTPEVKQFIARQKVFFVATAPTSGRINLSPKGMDTFRIVSPKRVIYLDITGSGNETAAHLVDNGRITIMFCSFDKTAQIVRLYGRGRPIHPDHANWHEYLAMFPPEPGLRQIMEIDVESAMTSCGYGVPWMENLKERDTLRKYWEKRDEQTLVTYQHKENERSIDGLPTGLFSKAFEK
jgi:Pyridoxamine 5'-phosphate oxidase